MDELMEIMNELKKIKEESSKLLSNISSFPMQKEESKKENKKSEVDILSEVLSDNSYEFSITKKDDFNEKKFLEKIVSLEEKQLKFEKLLVSLNQQNKERLEKIEKNLEILNKALANPILVLLKNNIIIDKEIKEIKNVFLNLNKKIEDIEHKQEDIRNLLSKDAKKLEQIIKKLTEITKVMSKFIKNELNEMKLLIETNKKIIESKNLEIGHFKDLEKKILFLIEEVNSIKNQLKNKK